MYLEHFGLNEPPFRITPVTVFFFSGANRGEILDALIYSISEVEGIIKVSGEVGSGKTMLCRMLLEKLPQHIEPIYLANPSLSREEMLYAIADGLGLNIKDERVGIIMQNIQNKLEAKAREGKRIVVLVDEAHAMPLDTLEELRLLYNLQVGNAKLMQIVLFGQPELNAKLEQPNMRQLKDRIAHHFHMQPLSRGVLENYLMFRMRAAGYHGPNIFSEEAIKLIADASNGLMRRVNILADKSLLAAFVEDTHNVEARHVKAAMRDSELGSDRPESGKKMLLGIATAALVLAGLIAWYFMDKPHTSPATVPASVAPALPAQPVASQPDSAAPAATGATANQPAATMAVDASPAPQAAAVGAGTQPATSPAPKPELVAAANVPLAQPGLEGGKPKDAVPHPSQPTSAPPAHSDAATGKHSLYEQRLEAGKQLVAQKKAVASIQLFYNEEIKPERIEGFLKRADGLGKLAEIYLLPAKFGSKDGVRVLYGAYPSVDAARSATRDLPPRYQNAFATSIYIF
ncbi:MAG: AAA family ATPase [Nitrosomonadales bacterium]|nr:AAA family ATPase [Nitrosomonadales bacterium]